MMSIRIILTSPHYPFITPFHKLAAEKQQECKNGLKRKSLSPALRSEKLRLLVTNRKGMETDVPRVRLYSHEFFLFIFSSTLIRVFRRFLRWNPVFRNPEIFIHMSAGIPTAPLFSRIVPSPASLRGFPISERNALAMSLSNSFKRASSNVIAEMGKFASPQTHWITSPLRLL
jgi:hypothetical protein